MMYVRSAAGLPVLGSASIHSWRENVAMETILAALQLLTRALEALKAYLGLMEARDGECDHPDARKHRPKHLKERQ